VGGFGFGGILGEHFGGEFCGVVGDFVEVAVAGVHAFAFFAGVALALGFGVFAEGGEEGFPGGGVRVGGFAVRVGGGVGVGGHGRFYQFDGWWGLGRMSLGGKGGRRILGVGRGRRECGFFLKVW